MPACPLYGRRPTPDCPNPQHIRLPGKCCKEWVCENLENTVIQDAITGMLSPLAGVVSSLEVIVEVLISHILKEPTGTKNK